MIAEYKNGKVVYREETEEEKKAQQEFENSIEYKQQRIEELKKELSSYYHIGVELAMGVATREEYAKEIAYCEELKRKIRELEQRG